MEQILNLSISTALNYILGYGAMMALAGECNNWALSRYFCNSTSSCFSTEQDNLVIISDAHTVRQRRYHTYKSKHTKQSYCRAMTKEAFINAS